MFQDRRPERSHDSEHEIVIPPVAARGAVVSNRVIFVLIVSLTLAFVAMAVLLLSFYSGQPSS